MGSHLGCDAALRLRCRTLLQSSVNMLSRSSLLALLAAVALPTAKVRADDVQRREDQFKAAYLYNFVKFIEWPSSDTDDTLTVCFLGGAGVQESLAAGIGAKRVGARKLAARQLQRPATVAGCEVLYADAASAN